LVKTTDEGYWVFFFSCIPDQNTLEKLQKEGKIVGTAT